MFGKTTGQNPVEVSLDGLRIQESINDGYIPDNQFAAGSCFRR